MAIRFVDKGSDDEGAKPKKPAAAPAVPEPAAEAVQADPPAGAADGQLPFAKSEPQPRGRKKPLR